MHSNNHFYIMKCVASIILLFPACVPPVHDCEIGSPTVVNRIESDKMHMKNYFLENCVYQGVVSIHEYPTSKYHFHQYRDGKKNGLFVELNNDSVIVQFYSMNSLDSIRVYLAATHSR